MPRNHQVQEEYEEFEVEAVLDRRTVPSEYGRTKVQYLLRYVGYPDPEWMDNSNCNCRSLIKQFLRDERVAAVNEAGPAGYRGEVVMDNCEALLATKASPLGIGDPAEEAGQPYGEPPDVAPIQPPAPSSIVGQTEKAMALLGQGFRLLGPVLLPWSKVKRLEHPRSHQERRKRKDVKGAPIID